MTRPIFVALLAAAACAGGPRYYVRPGATADDFYTDRAACKAQAISQGNAFLVPEVFRLCLEGRGWRETRSPELAAADELAPRPAEGR